MKIIESLIAIIASKNKKLFLKDNADMTKPGSRRPPCHRINNRPLIALDLELVEIAPRVARGATEKENGVA